MSYGQSQPRLCVYGSHEDDGDDGTIVSSLILPSCFTNIQAYSFISWKCCVWEKWERGEGWG
jgi:hypothetical protein